MAIGQYQSEFLPLIQKYPAGLKSSDPHYYLIGDYVKGL